MAERYNVVSKVFDGDAQESDILVQTVGRPLCVAISGDGVMDVNIYGIMSDGTRILLEGSPLNLPNIFGDEKVQGMSIIAVSDNYVSGSFRVEMRG